MYKISCIAGAAIAALAAPAYGQTVRTLPDVVVSASAAPLPSDQVGSAVTVIEREAIQRKQARFVSDLLREVPGVALSRSGPVGSITQVRIRGAEANQTLVLIDGVEVNDPSGASEFDLSTLLADDVERIEILRGPQSALYGSDAIGGVINIITVKGKGAPRVAARAEGGSFNTASAAAGVSGGGDAFDYALNVAGFRTAGVSSAPKSQGNTERDGYENLTASAKIGWRPTEILEFEAFGRIMDSSVESDPQPAVAGPIVVVDGDTITTSDQAIGRIQAKATLLDGAWEQIVSLGHAQDDQDTFENGVRSFTANGDKTRLTTQTNLFFETPGFASATHGVTLMAEREYEAQETRSLSGDSNLDIVNHGFVGEYRLGLWDRLFLSFSGRYDDSDIFEDATTVRATAAYNHVETGTRLHGSYGEGVKNPTLFELFGFGPNFVPNPALKPERSEGWDFGVEQSLFGGKAIVDVTYFENAITDLIQGAGNTSVNLGGTSNIRGVELSAAVQLFENTAIQGQFTYMQGEDAAGDTLLRRPNVLASLNLSHRFLDDKASVDLGVDYHGSQEDLAFSNFFANADRVTLDDYTLVNVGAAFAVTDGVEVFGRIENLLDEQYEDVFGFANPGIGAFIGVRATLGPF